jgi:hypothetical protein
LDGELEIEDVGAGKGLKQAATVLRVRFVQDYRGDLSDVCIDGESEEKQLQHGDEQREKERAGVADDVQKLLAAYGDEAAKRGLHRCASMMR